MADRQIGLKVMLEYGHFLQLAPINEADAKALMDKLTAGASSEVVRGHSFTEDGQPWAFAFQISKVVGMHTFSLEQRQAQTFTPNKPGGFVPHFGRS